MRSQDVACPDGRTLRIRPIAPEDAGPIAGTFHLLHEDEVRRRFLHPIKALSEDHIQRLTHPEPGRDFAVVAAEPLPPGEALVGAVARLSHDDKDGAEFGILVSHFIAGQGIGRLLMERLIAWCRAHGVAELYGSVMEDNTAMLALASRLGFKHTAELDASGLIRVSLPIR